MNTVSRETVSGGVPEPPAEAREFFGDQLETAVRFADLLAGPGIERGLLGPREVPRLWERHLLNCAVVHEAIHDGADVADVGSGAGLPGVVLALHRPDLSVTLVEPLLRRSRFLEEAVATLGLPNASVIRARVEELRGRLTVAVATARAVAGLATLAGWTSPMLRPRGVLVAIKGASAYAELADARRELARMGVASAEVRSYGAGVVDPPTRAVVIEFGESVRHPGKSAPTERRK